MTVARMSHLTSARREEGGGLPAPVHLVSKKSVNAKTTFAVVAAVATATRPKREPPFFSSRPPSRHCHRRRRSRCCPVGREEHFRRVTRRPGLSAAAATLAVVVALSAFASGGGVAAATAVVAPPPADDGGPQQQHPHPPPEKKRGKKRIIGRKNGRTPALMHDLASRIQPLDINDRRDRDHEDEVAVAANGDTASTERGGGGVFYGHDAEAHPFDLYRSHGRTLGEAERRTTFQPIRIVFDTTLVDRQVKQGVSAVDMIRINALKSEILPRVQLGLAGAISVVRAVGPIPIVPNSCFGLGPQPIKAEYIRAGGVPDADLVIFVLIQDEIEGEEICCDGCGTLAAATPCELDQFDRPVTGFVNVCLNEIPVAETADGGGGTGRVPSAAVETSVATTEHELTHVLGLQSELYKYYRNPVTGEPLTPRPFCYGTATCVGEAEETHHDVVLPSSNTLRSGRTGRGRLYYELVTPTVTTVARNHFGCQSLSGARLENQPTSPHDCFGSHFEEKLSYDETMSAYMAIEGVYFSALTLAALEDTGWYRANYTVAEMPRFGHMAGCDFLEKDCIVDGAVPDYARGFFCSKVSTMDAISGDVSGTFECDPSHTHKAMCDLFDLSKVGGYEPPPPSFQYFANPNIGPTFTNAEWCPIPAFSIISCQESHQSSSPSLPGETFDATSMCFNTISSQSSGDISVCLSSYCNEETRTLEVTIGEVVIDCRSDFEVHDYPGLGGNVTLECPRLATTCPGMFCPHDCSGRGTCDDGGRSDVAQRCHCFDGNDATSGCYETKIQPPREGGRECNLAIETKFHGASFVLFWSIAFSVLISIS